MVSLRLLQNWWVWACFTPSLGHSLLHLLVNWMKIQQRGMGRVGLVFYIKPAQKAIYIIYKTRQSSQRPAGYYLMYTLHIQQDYLSFIRGGFHLLHVQPMPSVSGRLETSLQLLWHAWHLPKKVGKIGWLSSLSDFDGYYLNDCLYFSSRAVVQDAKDVFKYLNRQ